jgi:predicted GNAT family acetyltransferase
MISNAYPNPSSQAGRSPASAERKTTFLIQESEATLSAAFATATIYACRDSEKIGALEFFRSNEHIRIDAIYVNPYWRGQGIGAALVRTLLLRFPLDKYEWEQPAATQSALRNLLAKALAVEGTP